MAEKPLAEDEVIVATEDGEIFTADNDADGKAFVEELADEVAEELNQEEPTEEAQETPAEESAEEEKPAKMGFFAKLKAGLDKTRKNILGGVDGVLGAFTKIDEDLFEELEEALIMADMGVQTTMDIVENLRKRVKREHATDPAVIKDMLIDEITVILQEGAQEDENLPSPSVLLVIGVNGVGKTTTIGKLAAKFQGGREIRASGRGGYLPCSGQSTSWKSGGNALQFPLSSMRKIPTLRRWYMTQCMRQESRIPTF